MAQRQPRTASVGNVIQDGLATTLLVLFTYGIDWLRSELFAQGEPLPLQIILILGEISLILSSVISFCQLLLDFISVIKDLAAAIKLGKFLETVRALFGRIKVDLSIGYALADALSLGMICAGGIFIAFGITFVLSILAVSPWWIYAIILIIAVIIFMSAVQSMLQSGLCGLLLSSAGFMAVSTIVMSIILLLLAGAGAALKLSGTELNLVQLLVERTPKLL